jgi:hypothetical protein
LNRTSMTVMRLPASCLTIILFFAPTASIEAQWIEAKSARYSIFYQSGYEKDAEFTRTWLDCAEDLLKSKYGVPFSGFYISLYLYPAPTQYADVGLAHLHCCSTGANGVKTGTISYLAPSALAWKGSPRMTSLGLPKDKNYHAKVIMSEYITVGHYVVQESRATTGGWKYYSAPEWFVQGLQEYDGIFHTTDANRDLTKATLFEWARNHPSVYACCSPHPSISNAYNGGATFMAFLAAQFGEEIHAKLLRDSASTFEAALENQTKPYHLTELFDKFRAWLASTATAQH